MVSGLFVFLLEKKRGKEDGGEGHGMEKNKRKWGGRGGRSLREVFGTERKLRREGVSWF